MSEVRNKYSGLTPAAERMRRYRARQRGEDIPRLKPGPLARRRFETIPASPATDRGYALDFSSVVRHVAGELAKAALRGATIAEMSASYSHAIPGDLFRVQLHHGLDSDQQAIRFLIDRALSALGVQAVSPGGERGPGQVREARRKGAYRLAIPASDLRYNGRPVVTYASEVRNEGTASDQEGGEV